MGNPFAIWKNRENGGVRLIQARRDTSLQERPTTMMIVH